jgi:cold shock CspA family protein
VTGIIKTLKRDRGYGFVAGDDGQAVFFLHTAVVNAPFDTLHVGQPVTFSIDKSAVRGPRAAFVNVVSDYESTR